MAKSDKSITESWTSCNTFVIIMVSNVMKEKYNASEKNHGSCSRCCYAGGTC